MHRGAAGQTGSGFHPQCRRCARRRAAALAAVALLGGCALRPPAAPPAAPAAPVPAAPAPAKAWVVTPADSLAASARALVGDPYRYGGAVPAGFDCSGLVQYAARSVGLALPRTADAQLHAGLPVTRDRLRSGDLVFMRLAGKELHVGIAIDAAHFVHAPSTRGHVRVDSLESEPYARGFITARRVL